MDDICASSHDCETHVDDVCLICETAEQHGFELKLKKGQFNQQELELWGCVCDKHGRKPQPRKIEQLEKWPEPTCTDDINSFLCFVNYLREFMPAEFIQHEAVLKALRKKKADFSLYGSYVKYQQAFDWIRKALAKHASLYHIDYAAAAHPNSRGVHWSSTSMRVIMDWLLS